MFSYLGVAYNQIILYIIRQCFAFEYHKMLDLQNSLPTIILPPSKLELPFLKASLYLGQGIAIILISLFRSSEDLNFPVSVPFPLLAPPPPPSLPCLFSFFKVQVTLNTGLGDATWCFVHFFFQNCFHCPHFVIVLRSK